MSSDRAGELGCHRDCLWSNWRKSTGGSWSMFFLQPVAPWGYVATSFWLGLCRKAAFQAAFQGGRSTRRASAAGSILLGPGARWQLRACHPAESCSQPGFTARNVVSQDGFPVTQA